MPLITGINIMNRRNFIKLFGLLSGVSLLPSLIKAEEVLGAPVLTEAGFVETKPSLVKYNYEALLTTNKFLEDIPKFGILGNALAYNRQSYSGIKMVTENLRDFHGTCEIAGLISSNSTKYHLVSKVKSCGRQAMEDVTNNNGLLANGKHVNGLQYLFDSNPEWLMANRKEIVEIYKVPEIKKYIIKNNIKVYSNDWMSVYESKIIAGKFDDGSHMKGCSLFHNTGTDSLKRWNDIDATEDQLYNGLLIQQVSDEIYSVKYFPGIAIWNEDDIMVINI